MKLLLVTPLQKQANGGIAVWTDMFLAACSDADIEPTVVNIAMTGRRLENGSAKRSLFDEIIRTRRIFRDLKSKLKGERFDAVHINSSCGKFGIVRDYLLAKKIKKKQSDARIVLQYHCDVPAQIRGKRARGALAKLAGIADENLVLCTTSGDYLKENFDVESRLVPNFIDERYILTEKKEIREHVARAFFVGRVQHQKGAPEIYELARRFPNIEFRLAGAVSAAISELETPENLTLLGPLSHDDVIGEMREADVFIFPSHTEGFSVALLEAMASGLPAIATDVGANRDMLSGIIDTVGVGEVDRMAEVLSELDSAEARERISAQLTARVTECYSLSSVVKRLREIYNER
ncbi:MAG: glycosyltransferase family 4 protein [Clostridia bacterium]|nr:glycosyltransferase family 4 protein [Clostridia bacterium]